ncbi:hypothetical protein BCR33DRAFT_425673 [Rhizoclosmatium globosum]|uniref:GH26 domain-containing protein n=1 Tax=Rhizoclosmatium globosum TaxID=329046 RepID=A0A1Y2BWT2_9FUNG|nr:hypothetical protein BCR33DRAFT_425673 [Rhizoclosmatium globosum]|eukprot:ORY38575.1 hypothetical protein BCR33DRAFT_425673 [Rhizoclosmatium globosum]
MKDHQEINKTRIPNLFYQTEMNGDWMNYGPPTAPEYYVRVWKRMYTIMKQYSPSTKIVWSPNFDLKPGNTEYWPGTDYVDVVGTSVYWKGFGYNNPMPPSYVSDSMATVYNEYAKVYQKPFVISECSAAWESGSGSNPGTGQTFASVTSSIDQVGFQKSFWTEVLSTKLLDSYPLLQAAYIFEDAKQEEFWTDFRVTNDTAVRTMFMGLIDTLDATGRMKWANPLTTTTTTTTTTTRAVSTAVATVISTTTKSGSFIASLGSSALALLACLL